MALAVEHAGRPDADSRRVATGHRGYAERPESADGRIELGHDVRDGVRFLDPGVTRLHQSGWAGAAGVGTRGSATIASSRLNATPRTLVPPMSIPNETSASAVRPAPDVRRRLDPRFQLPQAVDIMRLWPRTLMKPGIGTRSSASRWYRTCVPHPSAGSKT